MKFEGASSFVSEVSISMYLMCIFSLVIQGSFWYCIYLFQILGKALGSGVIPVSAILADKKMLCFANNQGSTGGIYVVIIFYILTFF